MKTILSTLLIGMTLFSNAQVIIGDAVGTASVKTSVLLDFAPNQNKGIILPYVRTLPTTPTEGTMVFDATDATKARVKFYNGAWIDLSGQDADVTNVLATQPTVAQVPEGDGEKVIIGAASSNANGVLVLESTTKSMVLPTVEDVQNIPNPSPGMMVYINKADAKRLAIFNGSKWSFWKP
jgi:Iap family predicted aminopeptidase